MATVCLAQSADGTLWICTQSGLFRFDGFHISREQLPVGDVVAVNEAVADKAGRLWIATETGLILRTQQDSQPRWSNVVRPDGAALLVEGKLRIDVDSKGTAFAMDKGSHLWSISAIEGARRLKAVPVALPTYETLRRPYHSFGAPVRLVGDDVWFGCGAGICMKRGSAIRRWDAGQGLPEDEWASILAARDGSIWVRSTHRLARLGPTQDRFESMDAPAAGFWPSQIALAEDASGAILTATDEGVARWDGHGWRLWTPRDGLPETAVRAILVDAEGAIWLATAGRGLHRWVGYGIAEHWTASEGLASPVVWSVARGGDGRLCASTSLGVSCMGLDSRIFHSVESPTHTRVGENMLSIDERGALWWKSHHRVMTLPSGSPLARIYLEDPTIYAVAQGKESVYLARRQDIARVVATARGPSREALPPELPVLGIPSRVISDGVRDWFLALGGAYRVDQERWTPLLDEHGVPLRIPDCAAFVGAAELWINTPQGLSVYAVGDGIARLSRRIDAAMLGGAGVLFIRADAERRVWIGTSLGVFISAGPRWFHFDRNNGLLWNDVSSDAIFFDHDGSTWIGTSAGVTRLLPPIRKAPPPVLRIEQFKVGDRVLGSPPSKAVHWGDRRIEITLRTPSIARGRASRLEYRMRDETIWHAFEGNVLKFESLDSDSYRMQVRVASLLPTDDAGPPLEIGFNIQAPWWRSVPAGVAYIALVAMSWMLSLQLLRRRALTTRLVLERAIEERTCELANSREAMRMLGAHNVLAQEEERKRVSRELHDEMGQQLAALRMEVSVLRRHAQAGRLPDNGSYDVLIRRVDEIVAGMRAVVEKLRPPALDGGLAAALDWLAAEFTRHSGVTCDVNVDDGARLLSVDAATMVFRVAQESLNNVRCHAAASKVSLSLRQHGTDYELSITDDGAGFDVDQPRTGFGLFGMEERARGFGGVISIESAPGIGTTVRLRINWSAE